MIFECQTKLALSYCSLFFFSFQYNQHQNAALEGCLLYDLCLFSTASCFFFFFILGFYFPAVLDAQFFQLLTNRVLHDFFLFVFACRICSQSFIFVTNWLNKPTTITTSIRTIIEWQHYFFNKKVLEKFFAKVKWLVFCSKQYISAVVDSLSQKQGFFLRPKQFLEKNRIFHKFILLLYLTFSDLAVTEFLKDKIQIGFFLTAHDFISIYLICLKLILVTEINKKNNKTYFQFT